MERIRVSSVICRESSNGTLKSARMMTRLPAGTCRRSFAYADSWRSLLVSVKQADVQWGSCGLAALALGREYFNEVANPARVTPMSYQAVTLTSRLSMTVVNGASTVAEWSLPF